MGERAPGYLQQHSCRESASSYLSLEKTIAKLNDSSSSTISIPSY